MTLNLSMPGQGDLKPRITVFGVGGAGGNAVNNMIEKELDGVDFVVANTDAQALQQALQSLYPVRTHKLITANVDADILGSIASFDHGDPIVERHNWRGFGEFSHN